ncbi:hypothetical protein [uncultured Chitinophaga sp.]|jgi:Vitamin K-dependent gamma-carboxylase.|uniref:hypothetical protein n=1 Tax=uncultured Chitinophaga sp. TaxID=339340 RepID=UPI00261C7C4D|nr:hypothetical protein [uncultured Chitinophaga sp.]
MNTFTHTWQAFFLAPSSSRPLVFFRIAITLLGLSQGIWLAGDAILLYGEQGLVQWPISEGIVGAHMPQLSWLKSLATATHLSTDKWVFILLFVYLAALTGLLAGKCIRVMALVAWALHFMLMNTGFMAAYGVETFMHIGLCYCIVMPVKRGAADSAWNTLSIRVLQLHLCIVYLASGIEKSMGIQWWNGEAIWQTLMHTQFSRFDMSWLSEYPWLARLICWSTLLVEIGYPVYMWFRPLRLYGYLAVVLLHLGIAICMGLELFGAAMIIFSTAAFGWPYVTAAWHRFVQWRKGFSRAFAATSCYETV